MAYYVRGHVPRVPHQIAPMGVTNGVLVFQRSMDAVVDSESLADTYPYLDNVTVGGRTQAEHDANVQCLLNALVKRNMTLNESKTISSVPEISILGYRVGYGTMKPDLERAKPLRQISPPATRKALRVLCEMDSSFLR